MHHPTPHPPVLADLTPAYTTWQNRRFFRAFWPCLLLGGACWAGVAALIYKF